MERTGDRGFCLSAEETARLINQQLQRFEQVLKDAISDTGDGEDGSRILIFPNQAVTDGFETLCASTEPPIEVAS